VRKSSTIGLITAAVLAIAAPALAENSVTSVALTSQSPNPSLVGQSVTLSVTVTPTSNPYNICAGSVDITDTTGGGSVAVCSATVTATGGPGSDATGSCSHAFPTAGIRSLYLSYVGNTVCQNSSGTASQVVGTAVPTLSEWALWGFAAALLLGGGGLVARRTRQVA
jgi:hypothetical protein